MSTDTRKPRASITVTILQDEDYLDLAMMEGGPAAFGLFIALIIAAKNQRNGGRFSCSDRVIASLVGFEREAFERALETLLKMAGKWVIRDQETGCLVVRNFSKWNQENRGGPRAGSGRPRSKNIDSEPETNKESKRNQTDFKPKPKGCASVSVSVSGSVTGTKEEEEEEEVSARAGSRISWSREAGWSGIVQADRDGWSEAYPACDIDRQLAQMSEWLLSNPAKASKSAWRRFITNWLKREQDRGGDLRGTNSNGKPANGQSQDGEPKKLFRPAPGVIEGMREIERKLKERERIGHGLR